MTKRAKLLLLFLLTAVLTLPFWTVRFGKSASAQSGSMTMTMTQSQQHQTHRDRRHMHMKNWALEPTGIPGVFPLDPTSIPKFVNQLTKPPVHVPVGTRREPGTGRNLLLYDVTAKDLKLQLLPPGLPTTKVYAYGGLVNFSEANQQPNIQTAFTFPGPTFEAVRNQRIFVHYRNDLDGDLIFPNDPTIMGANVNGAPIPTPPFKPFPPGYEAFQDPIPIVAHLHGGVTPSASDGFPEAWFTKDERKKGPAFTTSTFEYFNAQLPTTLWYHDHTLGMTRLLVAAGLEGTYILRDRNDAIEPLLPSGKFEVPLMLMDRAFNTDGSIHFTQVGDNPDIHPYWDPEYFGDTILVNGKVWPNLKVERRQYRFRIVNGSNARFYNLKLSNGQSFIQIGGDGSYLPAPVTLTEALIAPSERADILIDFSNLPAGTKIILQNTANQPFPDGDPIDPNTTGVVMRFEVQNTFPVHPRALPAHLIDIPTLIETEGIGNPKLFTLNEQESAVDEPVAVLIDGQHFDNDITEIPRVATTEAWYFQNLSEDAHPMHVHLVEFQLENRQDIDVDRFRAYWESKNGSTLPLDHPTVKVSVEDEVFDPATGTTHDFLTGPEEPPSPRESGWKDTFVAPPGKVTRVLIRFAPQYSKEANLVPGINPFPFDPTAGPGYVWHCHILDHEDNDMMRPMKITTMAASGSNRPKMVASNRRNMKNHKHH
jgi:FtsP/CotA-like multicopper oxidase with cupredoxin domain